MSKWGSQDYIGRTQSEFKEKYSQHSHNNWKAGTPEGILEKYDPESEKELEKIPKEKIAPKLRRKPKKNIGNLPKHVGYNFFLISTEGLRDPP